jgi:hypothetical protein
LVQEIEFIGRLLKPAAASAGAGNDVAIGIAQVMLYCETVFVNTEYPAHQSIVKRPESGIGLLRRAHHRERYREW